MQIKSKFSVIILLICFILNTINCFNKHKDINENKEPLSTITAITTSIYYFLSLSIIILGIIVINLKL